METVHVALGERSYDILIGHGLLDRAAEYLAPLARDGRLLVVSDEAVWTAAGGRLRASLGDIEAMPILVPAGEASKSWAGLQTVVDALLAQGVERSDRIAASRTRTTRTPAWPSLRGIAPSRTHSMKCRTSSWSASVTATCGLWMSPER